MPKYGRKFKQPQQPANVRKWEAKFKKLKEYKKKKGHCNVPRSHLELGNWVNTQRSLYKHEKRYKEKKLSEERINRLNKIGFNPQISAHYLNYIDSWGLKY